jgi:hypothetical protein
MFECYPQNRVPPRRKNKSPTEVDIREASALGSMNRGFRLALTLCPQEMDGQLINTHIYIYIYIYTYTYIYI